jgi:hypothetical protein
LFPEAPAFGQNGFVSASGEQVAAEAVEEEEEEEEEDSRSSTAVSGPSSRIKRLTSRTIASLT